MIKVHYLQHVEFEGIGSIQRWLDDRNCTVTSTKLYLGEIPPSADEIDFLIIMGGPMSVNEEHKYSWLKAEKEFIAECLERKLPILGICLGAQLISNVLGSTVHSMLNKEIGWFPITATLSSNVHSDYFRLPDLLHVLHWHGETFDLPSYSKLLGSSQACTNQGFELSNKVIGLQFHLEMDEAQLEKIIENCRDELSGDSPFIQKEEDIKNLHKKHFSQNERVLRELLNYLTNDIS